MFSIEGKTTEEKVILNISDSLLEMLFLSTFNTLVGILLSPANLLESNKDMIFSISVVSVRLGNGNIRSIFKKIRKMILWKWNIKLHFISYWRKIVVENIWDCHWIGNGGTINRKALRNISRNVFNSYNRFYAFPCIFDAAPVGFKVMIVVISFALLQNCK